MRVVVGVGLVFGSGGRLLRIGCGLVVKGIIVEIFGALAYAGTEKTFVGLLDGVGVELYRFGRVGRLVGFGFLGFFSSL
jgi:hypothetical protein